MSDSIRKVATYVTMTHEQMALAEEEWLAFLRSFGFDSDAEYRAAMREYIAVMEQRLGIEP